MLGIHRDSHDIKPPRGADCVSVVAVAEYADDNKKSVRIDQKNVATVVCEHDCVLGAFVTRDNENWALMSIVLMVILIVKGILPLVFVYDCACRFFASFVVVCTRVMAEKKWSFPPHYTIKASHDTAPDTKVAQAANPSMHITSHGSSCQVNFHLDRIEHIGAPDGEGTERVNSHLRSMQTSIANATAAHYHDMLNTSITQWNFRKFDVLPGSIFLIGRLLFHSFFFVFFTAYSRTLFARIL